MILEYKTGFEWCREANLRLLNIMQWDTNMAFCDESYYEEKISQEEFLRRIAMCDVKPNSSPRKTEMYLEYRMYGLVPYNMSPIQQAIQFGHAVVEYQQNTMDIEPMQRIYNKWAKKDKTFIILNGGTTNTNIDRLGTLNKNVLLLQTMGIDIATFNEPDLGDQLTAVVFLVDERVFNRELYPDFVKETLPYSRIKPSPKVVAELEERNDKNYSKWVEKIGGPKNAFLREFLPKFRLA